MARNQTDITLTHHHMWHSSGFLLLFQRPKVCSAVGSGENVAKSKLPLDLGVLAYMRDKLPWPRRRETWHGGDFCGAVDVGRQGVASGIIRSTIYLLNFLQTPRLFGYTVLTGGQEGSDQRSDLVGHSDFDLSVCVKKWLHCFIIQRGRTGLIPGFAPSKRVGSQAALAALAAWARNMQLAFT